MLFYTDCSPSRVFIRSPWIRNDLPYCQHRTWCVRCTKEVFSIPLCRTRTHTAPLWSAFWNTYSCSSCLLRMLHSVVRYQLRSTSMAKYQAICLKRQKMTRPSISRPWQGPSGEKAGLIFKKMEEAWLFRRINCPFHSSNEDSHSGLDGHRKQLLRQDVICHQYELPGLNKVPSLPVSGERLAMLVLLLWMWNLVWISDWGLHPEPRGMTLKPSSFIEK